MFNVTKIPKNDPDNFYIVQVPAWYRSPCKKTNEVLKQVQKIIKSNVGETKFMVIGVWSENKYFPLHEDGNAITGLESFNEV